MNIKTKDKVKNKEVYLITFILGGHTWREEFENKNEASELYKSLVKTYGSSLRELTFLTKLVTVTLSCQVFFGAKPLPVDEGGPVVVDRKLA